MASRNDLTPRGRLLFGGIFVAMGLFIVLVGAGVIYAGRRTVHAPMWLIALVGAAFALAGGSVMLSAASPEVESDGTLPASAPFGLRLAQFVFGLVVTASLAITGSWIAFGEGERNFSVSGIGIFGDWIKNDTVGRIIFGLGAILCWVFLVLIARQGWRRLTRT